jgi:hypothetical protein
MATSQEVLDHMTGHTAGQPTRLNWQLHFRQVQRPPQGNADAFTHVDFNPTYSFSSRADPDGKHRLSNVRVQVRMNQSRSWLVIGRGTPLLLRHEQGHYDITFLVARELCRRLLELEWDSAVLTAVGESSSTQIVARLRTDAERLCRSAQTESTRINTLYDDPARGSKNANGSINPQAQTRWDQMIQHAIQNDTGLSVLVMLTGGNPRSW